MGNTLDDILAGANPTIVAIVAVEGYGNLLTTGSAAAAVTAWAGTDWTAALEGLDIDWSMDQALDPWNPFSSSSSLTFRVMDCDGTDRFGIDTHRREGGTSTKLAANVAATATTVTCARVVDFPASGTIYLGCEAMDYSSKNDGTGVITISTRGKWSPFPTESGGRFARAHQLTQVSEGVPPSATAATTVRTHPTEWAGRWVGVWLHAVRSGGVLDTKAEAHLAFAGRIAAGPQDTTTGLTKIICDDVRKTFRDTVILRHQFRARVKEGIYLPAGLRFICETSRTYNGSSVNPTEVADPLLVVAGAPGANEIAAGWYAAAEVGAELNTWLAAEKAAGRVLFDLTYNGVNASDEGIRPSLRLDDSDATGGNRAAHLNTAGTGAPEIRAALGWAPSPSGGMDVVTGLQTKTTFGPNAPVRVNAGWVAYDSDAEIRIEVANGEFVDQTSSLPSAAQSAGFSDGIIRIGDDMFACDAPVLANGEGTVNVRRIRELDAALGAKANKLLLTVEDAGDLNVSQVLISEGTLKTITMMLMTSTGGSSFNGDWDQLPAQCGAAIPWSLFSEAFENELDAADAGSMCVVVESPTSLAELLGASFTLRNIAPMWSQGRLTLTGFATPTTSATTTLTADDKATSLALADGDGQRAVGGYNDKWRRNVVRLRHNRSIVGDTYRDTINVLGVDVGEGERRATIDCRNAVLGAGFITGEDIRALLPSFMSGLSFLTRAALITRVPVDYTKFETLIPGTVLLFTDPHMRDPTTGERGVTGKPALVVGHSYSWGGSMIGEGVQEMHGELDLMMFPQMSLAAYCPTAEVDHTALNGGYDAGGPSLACKSHMHSETFEDVDASRLFALDEVTIVEIDPPDPTAPLSWDRDVVSVVGDLVTISAVLAAPAWDATKKYRIVSRNYSAAASSQRANTYQADDADAMVENTREPYGYGHGVQVSTGTAVPATTLARGHVAASFGDGAALHTGAAYDTLVNLNNLVSYATAPQMPVVYSEPSTFSGSGTRRLVRARPQFVGVGRLAANQARKLWVAPRFKSDDGTACSVRVSLCRNPPRSADPTNPSLMDVERVGPYTEVTFTTSSTSYSIPTADDLDIAHLKLDDTLLGGVGWLLCELTNHAVFDGLAECWVGPVVTP